MSINFTNIPMAEKSLKIKQNESIFFLSLNLTSSSFKAYHWRIDAEKSNFLKQTDTKKSHAYKNKCTSSTMKYSIEVAKESNRYDVDVANYIGN